ncbi:MAG: hypothetical protein PVH88_27025 [Ignavibacteria bacterium]
MRITILILVLLIAGCNSSIKDERKIETAVMNELKYYPEERLIDLYKSYFQGYWGPGHLIKDTSSALNYINYELETAEKYDSIIYQPLGHYDKFLRLNLLLVKENIIPKDEYLNSFIQSANSIDKPNIEDWKKEWDQVLSVIDEIGIKFENYEKDKSFIDSLLSENKYVVHHSKEFVEIYNPHYRVISKKHFEELKRKYFKKR